jgi:molybdopterin biosynthesis enzyme
VFQSPFRAIAEESFHRHRDGKIHFVRAFASLDGDGSFCVHPLGGQGSHHLHAMATANALAVLPDGEGIERGAPLRILLTTPDQFAEAAVSV